MKNKKEKPMKQHTMTELKNMSLESAQNEISNAIYQASALFELLEYAGKVRGNGHHIAQDLGTHASEKMAERWVENE